MHDARSTEQRQRAASVRSNAADQSDGLRESAAAGDENLRREPDFASAASGEPNDRTDDRGKFDRVDNRRREDAARSNSKFWLKRERPEGCAEYVQPKRFIERHSASGTRKKKLSSRDDETPNNQTAAGSWEIKSDSTLNNTICSTLLQYQTETPAAQPNQATDQMATAPIMQVLLENQQTMFDAIKTTEVKQNAVLTRLVQLQETIANSLITGAQP